MSASTLPTLGDLAADDALVVHRRRSGFDAAWKEWQGGVRPVLEDWLVDGPAAVRAVLLRELLRLDLEYRRKGKERPVLADYLHRFRADEGLLRLMLTEPAGSGDGLSQDSTVAPLTAQGGMEATVEHATPMASALPKSIGRYRVERVLGQGGFGRVYLAHDDQLRRLVAIKVPHAELVARPGDAEPYLTEARTVAGLEHPNIVTIYDVGETNDFPVFVVSRYVDGSDLKQRLKETRPTVLEAVEWTATVAETLHFAHGQGLVHRDIKPGNILLDKSGKPYVADFGLALKEENVGKGPRFLGTPSYMSPEQARGEGHRVDGRSDIFSLGIVFYELLTGRRPFHADSGGELREQITNMEARPPRQWDDTIPKELERICLKALSKRASERYTTAKDMADDLRLFLGSVAVAQQAAVSFKRVDESAVSTPAPDQRPIEIVPKLSTVISETQPNRRGRKLPGRLAACVALTGLGLALWLVIAAFWRNNEPGPNADRPETSPRSLDSLKRDAPYQLLDSKPLPVGWDLDNPRWQSWNQEEKILQVTGGPSRLFVIGTTTLRSYDFEVDIKQAPWTGEVGIFWGYHEDAALKQKMLLNQAFAWFHFLRIEHRIGPNGEPVRFVHRGKGSLSYNQQQEVAVNAPSFFVQSIQHLVGQVHVKIVVKGNRLLNAEVARDSLNELCSGEANASYQDLPYQGGVGLLTLAHTATFSEVRFVSRSNP